MKILIILLLAFVFNANAQWLSDCGRSKYSDPAPEKPGYRTGRIVGGWESRENEFPYQVSLRKFGGHSCGAVILNKNWVISAAHCLPSGSIAGVTLVAGSHRRSNPLSSEQTSTVLKVINHEKFHDPYRYSNDINLLQLATPFNLNENVSPICEPRSVDYLNEIVTISGWGYLRSGGSTTDELRYTNVAIKSRDECVQSYPNRIDDSMICASATGRDTCQGDSGGPMAFNNNGKFELVGLTSWGRGCALPGYPGVYAKVSHQLEWIKKNTE